MKLLLPVATLVFAAGFCCCGGDTFSQFEELSAGGAPSVDVGGAPAASGGGGGGGGATTEVSGTCGKFVGLKAPAGASVMACTTSGDTDSLVLLGGAKPAENCEALKEWAKGAGYSIDSDVNAMGSYAVMATSGSSQLTMACTDVGGQTTSSLSISPKM